MLSKWVVLNSIFAFGTCIENQSVFWIVPPPPPPGKFCPPLEKSLDSSVDAHSLYVSTLEEVQICL